ncbi:nucleotide exchange factor GrpE [Phenylobacterium sp.]|jgi:molecular chaperone GrpE|uniref:nucleotide exchange factor GrpE n=1 Tax=Phenylobacterium sp. TaxID=1871053 RepID=UPI0037837407
MSEDTTPSEHEDASAADEAADQVLALKAEAAALKEQVLRYAADMENTRRRAEKEANDARAYAIQKFARDLLGVADNLARATAHAPADHADSVVKNFVVGVEMTEKELLGAFERNGLKKIDPKAGDKFDPHQHQAMAEQPGDGVAPGSVLQVMQPGYELLGRLIRPAMVVVAARGAAPSADPSAGGANGGPSGGYGAADEATGGSVDRRA